MNGPRIPQPVLERLCRLFVLCGEWERIGRESFTSRDAARYLDTSAATVRKDLSWLSSDHPGAAYPTTETRVLLETALGLAASDRRKACIIGLGDLGLALWESQKRKTDGWQIVAGFDSRRNRLEQLDIGLTLYPSTEIAAVIRRENIGLAILAVEAEEAQKMTERLMLGGITAILNLSPVLIRVNKNTLVRQAAVDLELTTIQALLNRGDKGEIDGTRI